MSYKLIRDFTYPFGKGYRGQAVESDFEFRVPKGPGSTRIADDLIRETQRECAANNLDTLRMRVWCDKSPFLEDDYFVTFSLYSREAHGLSGAGAHALVPPLWLIALIKKIIPYVLAIIILVLIRYIIREIRDIAYSPAGPELAEALKWGGIALAIFAGAMVIRAVSDVRPRRAA